MPIATEFRSTRLVASYHDNSELHFLNKEGRYVWCRPRESGKGLKDVPIPADSDEAALDVVRSISQKEFEARMFTGRAAKRRN